MTKESMLAKKFKDFKNAVIPENASEFQIKEMEKAFYCGSSVMLSTIDKALDNSASDDEFISLIWSVRNELIAFAEKASMSVNLDV